MRDLRDNWIVELLVHLLVLAVGVILLLLGKDWEASPYAQAVMANLGSGLIAVTILFLITRFFSPRQSESKTTETSLTAIAANKEPLGESSRKAAEYAEQLRQSEVHPQSSLTTSEKKVRS